MTEEHARSLLGVEPNATGSEIANAYRRLMQTVHPDVCKGPEAERLAQQATDAREMLAARTTAPKNDDQTPHDHNWALQEIVLHVLNQRGESTRLRILVIEAITIIRQLAYADTDAWSERLTEAAFWRNGEAKRLWTIDGTRISPTNVKNRRDDSSRRNRNPSGNAHDDTNTAKAWRTEQFTRMLIAATTEWIAAVAVVMLVTVMACTAVASIPNASTGHWWKTVRYATLILVAFNIIMSINRKVDFPDNIFKNLLVLLPGISGGFLITWGILNGLVWLETALQ